MIKHLLNSDLQAIATKILDNQRINTDEALKLYHDAPLSALAYLADVVRVRKNEDKVFFNRNIHLEPTNLCVFTCKFCSYSRTLKESEEGWFMSIDAMLDEVMKHDSKPITEIHIVGGVHPKLTLDFFCEALQRIKSHRPEIHIKGFTAVELEYMFRKAKVSYDAGFERLKAAGLDSIPGGGAEIFDDKIRSIICADKCNTTQWLDIHKSAHKLGLPSNCTMLYGHYETYEQRVHHMLLLRDLQDETNGFNTFIPLKYRNEGNEMSSLKESTTVKDLRCYAMSRIFLDNINHIKAYWPMLGRETTQLTLQYGVDDIDGTIDDTTKIYSMAGSEEQTPVMSTQELVMMIRNVGRKPIERDTVYNTIQDYSNYVFEETPINSFLSLPVLN
jgi:aminodeoxyfutalosine synthase